MNTQSLESDVIRNAVRGSWLSVLDSLAPELERAILKPGRHIGCPVHGGKDGFKLFRDANISGGGICNTCGAKPDGFSLLMWLRGWRFPDALMAVSNVLGLSTDEHHQRPIVAQRTVFAKSKSSVDDNWLKAILRTVWQESKSLHHPDAEPVRLYLQSRGLDSLIPDWPSIRFHPNMQYKDDNGKLVGYYPAMLALIQKGNEAITIHRTFLTPNGCKVSADSKKWMPVPSDKIVTGSAIRLGNPGRVLCVTEGIETALAVIEATGMVTWPLINATLMARFEIPDGVEKLIIWSDLDRPSLLKGIQAGSEAATKLAERAEAQGIEAVIREPKGPIPIEVKSIDWLDVLNQRGPNAFAIRSCS